MTIHRLRLENIGPFDHLDLPVDPSWTMLLGNNGVGKSIILKAIAVGLCGDETETYAARLIKSGRDSAGIVLETRQDTYVTRLDRTDSGAALSIESVSPLRAEGWLALGFPSMRALTWHRAVRGPRVPTVGSPTAVDLHPLLAGELDPRLDDVKQWIVELDHEIRAGAGENRHAAQRSLEELFYVTDFLASGQRLEFHDVNRRTWTVHVRTADGVIPIEAVSHGTAALFGMAGTILRRLREVYGHAAMPREEFALVLIDEIDAHLHPTWQQTLTSRLQQIFPRLQFIATSHSPLIAGSLRPPQIHRVRRDQEGLVTVEPHRSDLTGLRADEILTGPLFQLESTLDFRTQALLTRYTELAARDTLSPADQEELDAVLQAINKKLLAEVKIQLQELISGSRSPRR
jgi:hypothetical protein